MHKPIACSILVLLFCITSSHAQFSKYIIRFRDKAGTPYSINNPSQYLSAKSIERRTKQKITIDQSDLPITPRYLDSVRLAGNVTILNSSKWLNQVCIFTTDAAALAKINSFSFIENEQPLMRMRAGHASSNNKFNEQVNTTTTTTAIQQANDFYNYGNTFPQIHIHEGEFLHNSGFHGEGMLLAIMDAGFYHYQSISAFDSVRANHQIAETYDFVNNETSVDEDHPHGMECFSIIAGNIPGQFVGSCPKATFYLYRTEDAATEFPIEEQNWVAAAERADSIGVDVFSTSLGYTTFDNSIFDHTYADMNGNTTIIARGCDMAAKKGIISVVAAGNEGTSGWHFIGTPADADSCVSVGAVDNTGVPANFSSYGPSSDGQIKPTVASVGLGTAIITPSNVPAFSNGTSFATPNMAGLITCLWQAFPDFTNMEIIEAVKRSSSMYTNPDDRIGYGIPDFHKAFDDLTSKRALRGNILKNDWIKAYPNPFKGNLSVVFNPQNTGSVSLKLFDASGRLYSTRTINAVSGLPQTVSWHFQPLSKGIYLLEYNDGKTKRTTRILAQ
ncbi:MAG: S8 family serine peptidase [Ginsengibacter sp.]